MRHHASHILLVLLAGAACVPTGRYEAAVRDAQASHTQTQLCNTELSARALETARLDEALAGLKTLSDQRDANLVAALQATKGTQGKLDEATAENAELRKELERLGKDADKLLSEKGTLAGALDQARARLAELRKAEAAAGARAALFHQLALKFQKMIDAGELKISLRDGRMVLELANDVLFDSGLTDIKPGGQQALKQVAAGLKTLPTRRFQVAGHTDNVPIQTARAVQVARFLVAQGVKPEELSAAGYGEFDPIAPNAEPSGRARNRRIEITLQPNIDELVAIPQ